MPASHSQYLNDNSYQFLISTSYSDWWRSSYCWTSDL